MNRIPFGDRPQPASVSTPTNSSYRLGSGLVRHRWAVWLRRGLVPAGLPPATLARDIGKLSERYTLRRAIPVDMFPQTASIETAALLEKRTE